MYRVKIMLDRVGKRLTQPTIDGEYSMEKRRSLKTKLIIMGLGGPLVLGLAITALLLFSERSMLQDTEVTLSKEMRSNLTNVGKGVYDIVSTQDQLLHQKLTGDLAIATDQLERAGGVKLAPETVTWEALDPTTKTTTPVTLPRMLVGDTWLGQNNDIAVPSLVVDRTQELVGGTCTIFQRMNEAGDMLRVCTNVKTLQGKRAIGTFISAKNGNGENNPVIAAVIKGDTYVGKALVVNKWCVAAYKPLKSVSGEIVGMLFVGIPQESVTDLRKAIMGIQVGATGNVFVLGGSNGERGKYIISPQGKRDGEVIWEAKDNAGNLFIQEIVTKALTTKDGQCDFITYPLTNENASVPRQKTCAVTYYAPWDWVIVADAYDDETMAGLASMQGSVRTTLYFSLCVSALVLLITGTLGVLFSARIAKALRQTSTDLGNGADQTASAAGQVAQSSQAMAQGASEQASSLEETSAALAEITSMIKQNAENANQARIFASSANSSADKGAHAMAKMTQAIDDIKKSSDSTAKIIKTIDEIAFQTNLLALNAAVEAARAGDSGKGFAVVAEEVRNLAQRSAEAARNTASMIEESVAKANNGVVISREVGESLHEIAESVRKVNSLVDEISTASNQQAEGVEQVNSAMTQMDKATQSNAAYSEEAASIAQELSEQAESMRESVDQLALMVGGVESAKPEPSHTAELVFEERRGTMS